MICHCLVQMAWRPLTGGQTATGHVLVRFSPAPSPKGEPPAGHKDMVAAFCATTAG